MGAALTEELARMALELSPEAQDAMKQLARVLDEVIDDLASLERVAVFGRDCETLAEHLANLHALRQLRQEFVGSESVTGIAVPPRTS
jgi:hypothetical protein